MLIAIFILTNSCLFGQVWRKYEMNGLNYIAVDNQGNKWFSTYDGVYMFDNSDWTKLDINNGLAPNKITSILIDNLGNKWFGSFSTENTDSTFVTKFDGINWTKYNVSDSSSNYDHSAIWDIKQDSLGNIWFATTSGVSMFNGISWNYYHINDGLPSDYIRCINFDNYGNKWFGSRNGLTKFTDTTWVTYCTPDTIYGSYANNIYSIDFDSQNILWAGGSLGLYKLVNSKMTKPNESIFTSVNKVAFDKNGMLWLGVSNGFVTYSGNWNTRITSANEGINSIAVDLNNDVWLGTYSWAVKYSDIPLILDVSPQVVQFDTLIGSTNYFVINSNTDWTIDYDYGTCDNCRSLFSFSKYSGSDSDTIWVTALQKHNPLSVKIRISEFGQTFRTITVIQDVYTNIKSNFTSSINIYPNPIIDNLYLESTSQNNIRKLEIYSINGSLLSFIESPEAIINMSSFDEGIYVIKLYGTSSIETKKIIKLKK